MIQALRSKYGHLVSLLISLLILCSTYILSTTYTYFVLITTDRNCFKNSYTHAINLISIIRQHYNYTCDFVSSFGICCKSFYFLTREYLSFFFITDFSRNRYHLLIRQVVFHLLYTDDRIINWIEHFEMVLLLLRTFEIKYSKNKFQFASIPMNENINFFRLNRSWTSPRYGEINLIDTKSQPTQKFLLQN